MSRFLRHAAVAAAAAGGLSTAVSWTTSSSPVPLSASASTSSFSPTPSPAAPTAGGSAHLALVRAHPGLRELNALLTPGTFLLDGTQALLAAALRHAPFYPETLRGGRAFLAAQILAATDGSEGDAEELEAAARFNMAVLDAREGDLEYALEALACLAAERPRGPAAPRLHVFATALCHLLGRPEEEAERWLRDAGVPDLASREDHKRMFLEAVMIASQGRAPGSAAEDMALFTLHELVEFAMWSVFKDGDLSERLQVLALMGFLRGVVGRKLRSKDVAPYLQRSHQDATPPTHLPSPSFG